ncbi:hypothetical protein TNCV_1563961 [Trichonephila clavipes]|nr:hypothetical protein TNCV_1563961 [Trichonephila clavipes]
MSFDPVKIVVAFELKEFEFNGIEITGFICKIIKKENRGETVSKNVNFSIMMNCPTDRETDGRELCKEPKGHVNEKTREPVTDLLHPEPEMSLNRHCCSVHPLLSLQDFCSSVKKF